MCFFLITVYLEIPRGFQLGPKCNGLMADGTEAIRYVFFFFFSRLSSLNHRGRCSSLAMGVIVDGTITGVLPEARVFAVHYPAYPSSTSRAVETLGGIDEIAKRRSSKAKYIELRFRPEDPHSHPAFGDLRTSKSFLLKISKKKSIPKPSEGSGEEQLCADIVARVAEAYHFNGMADYQYVLPVHAVKSKKKRKRWPESEPSFERDVLMDFEHDDLMMLVPPLFSLKDIPEEIVLKAPPTLISKQLQKGVTQQTWEMDIEPSHALSFTIDKIPKKVNWEDNIPKDSVEWSLQMAVSKLFDEKPIWPRQSIVERLADDGHYISSHLMRRLLYRSGYYFATGPFGKFWIRKGYDPRSDTVSQIYQKVDFRIPGSVREFANAITKDRSKTRWKDICQFQAIPFMTFTCLQIFELEDEYIQKEIKKPTQKKTCTHSTGWLSRSMLEILMLHTKIRFLSLIDNVIVNKLVRSCREQVQRINTRLLYGEPDNDEEDNRTKGTSLEEEQDPNDEEEDPSFSRGSMNRASKFRGLTSHSLQPVRDGDEEPHEVEDEEEEEELDEYNLPPVADGADDFPVDGNSHNNGENITSDYLQEILSGFHTREGYDSQFDQGLQTADTSDGEYQIYEQDSDYADDYLDD